MTGERAREIAKIFDDNYAMAQKMGANHTMPALVAATVYTIDDLLAARERFIKSQPVILRRTIRKV